MPEHRHENEQLGICLSGSLRVPRGRRDSRISAREAPGRFRSNVPHEVHVGPEGAVVLDDLRPAPGRLA